MKKSSLEKLTNMTGSNLGKLLVVANLVARRIDLCKDSRDPSGERWNYLSRRLSCNFAEMIAFTPFRDLFLHLQTCLVRNLGFCLRVLDLQPISAKYGLGP
jgi:hypothetical protein